MHCYVYLLLCRGDTLYCGWTNDICARLAAHQSGRGAKYTRSHAPVTLAYLELLPDRSTALRREAALKRLPRQEKLRLVETRRAETEALFRQAQSGTSV